MEGGRWSASFACHAQSRGSCPGCACRKTARDCGRYESFSSKLEMVRVRLSNCTHTQRWVAAGALASVLAPLASSPARDPRRSNLSSPTWMGLSGLSICLGGVAAAATAPFSVSPGRRSLVVSPKTCAHEGTHAHARMAGGRCDDATDCLSSGADLFFDGAKRRRRLRCRNKEKKGRKGGWMDGRK